MGNDISFDEIFEETMRNEGGYVNDSNDRGGETFRGISRKWFPDWEGWTTIDSYKSHPDFPKVLDDDLQLQTQMKQFYKQNFWIKPKYDKLPDVVGAELFDTAVNMGIRTASKMLQEALNLLNRNGKLYDDLKVDGVIGNKTLEAVRKVKPHRLLKVLNGLQFMRYYEIMLNDKTQEKFVGWFDRL